jgi:hypothetical protein
MRGCVDLTVEICIIQPADSRIAQWREWKFSASDKFLIL